MEKLLTVVVPVYNMEKYLRKCLDSLVIGSKQDLLEVIVVIDGSRDNSFDIALTYQEKYPSSFIVINKENGGHGSCCNLGLEMAKGKYIHFLDSDDWFDYGNFTKFMELLSKLNVDLVQTNKAFEFVDSSKTKICDQYREVANRIYAADEFPYILFDRLSNIHDSTYKTDTLRLSHIEFTEKAPFDDTILYIKPFSTIKTIYCSNMVVYHYLLGREGQSVGGIDEQKVIHRKNEFLKLCEDYQKIRTSLSKNQQIYFDKFINKEIFNEFYYCASKLPVRLAKKYIEYWDDFISKYPYTNIYDIPYKRKYRNRNLYIRKTVYSIYSILRAVMHKTLK